PLAVMASSGVIWLIWRFARQHKLRRPPRGDQGTSSLDPTQESFAPWTHTQGSAPVEPQGEDFSPSPASLPQPGTLSVPPNGGPRFRRPPRHSAKRPRLLSQRDQQRISVATIFAYSRFRREVSAYHHTFANHLIILAWTSART